MTRTYYIKHNTIDGVKFDKVTHRSTEDRPRWHKVEALTTWKQEHRGYGFLRIDSVFTTDEMKANGYM